MIKEASLTVSTRDNPPVLLLNTKVAITHFESDTRQLFETEEGSFIYQKDTQVLAKIDTDKYTRLLLKLIRLQEDIEEKEKQRIWQLSS